MKNRNFSDTQETLLAVSLLTYLIKFQSGDKHAELNNFNRKTKPYDQERAK